MREKEEKMNKGKENDSYRGKQNWDVAEVSAAVNGKKQQWEMGIHGHEDGERGDFYTKSLVIFFIHLLLSMIQISKNCRAVLFSFQFTVLQNLKIEIQIQKQNHQRSISKK